MDAYLNALKELHPNHLSGSQAEVLLTAVLRAAQTRNETFRHHDAILSRNGKYPLEHSSGFTTLIPDFPTIGNLKHDARLDSTFYRVLLNPPNLDWPSLARHHRDHWVNALPWEKKCYDIVARNFAASALDAIVLLLGTSPAPSSHYVAALNDLALAIAKILEDLDNSSLHHMVYAYLPRLSLILSFLLLERLDRTGRGKGDFERIFGQFLLAPASNPTHYNLNIEPRAAAFQNSMGHRPLPNKYLRIGVKLGETVLTEPAVLPQFPSPVPASFVVFLEEPSFTTVHFGTTSLIVRRQDARQSTYRYHGTIVAVQPVPRVDLAQP